QFDLRIAMLDSNPIVINNTQLDRIAGECILRSTLHTLGFSFVYVANSDFTRSYLTLFGCPIINPQATSFSSELLERRMFSNLLENKAVNGVKEYRLRHSYITALAARLSPPVMVDPAYELNKNPNMVYQAPPQVIAAIIDSFTEAHLAQVGKTFGDYLPSILDNAPLQDFSRYMSLWYPVSLDPNTLAAPNSSLMTDGDLTNLRNQGRAGTLRLSCQNFGVLY
ncbi:hypothetical protein BGX27_005917, partial [Mortierella sp. AM989]